MNDKETIYVSALLHDIGKFIERGKLPEWKSKAEKYVNASEVTRSFAHRRFSAAYVNYLLDKQKDFVNHTVESLVLYHHKGDDFKELNNSTDSVMLNIIRKADQLSSSERRQKDNLTPVDYYLAKLQSPFCDISLDGKETPTKKYLNLKSVSDNVEFLFPTQDNAFKNNEYPELIKSFINESENIDDIDSLIYLMEKYLSNVPAQTPFIIKDKNYLYQPDINLFDHSRVSSAIALCLWDEYENGCLKNNEKEILGGRFNDSDIPCILINGNFSGIQNFIFNITSKKAARKLKARSYFIQLFSEVIARFIIDNLQLEQANILYNGGGNMFILAPKSKENIFKELYKQIEKAVKDIDLFFAIGITDVKFSDFEAFNNIFSKATHESDICKKRKFKDLEYQDIFSPVSQKLNKDKEYEKLADELLLINDYAIFQTNSDLYEKDQEYQAPFYKLGYRVETHPEKTDVSKSSILLNNTNFSKDYSGYKYTVVKVPVWTKESLSNFKKEIGDNSKLIEELADDYKDSIKTFKAYSIDSLLETGTQKIGILKMDVDNLGRIISSGLNENDRTISRIASLSRSIKLFFETYMNNILNTEMFKDKLYVIFSGGDDFFVVGAWNVVFDFAHCIYNKFKEFVCNNESITLSASLLILDENFPVSRFASISEERLHKAKNYDHGNKDSLSIFDSIIKWKDFDKVIELKNLLVDLITKYEINKAILEKIRKSTKGFEKLQSKALNGKIELKRVWRFSYYLREYIKDTDDLKKNEAKKIIKEKLINVYEKLLLKALKNESTEIKIFPIAARWAELLTRESKTI